MNGTQEQQVLTSPGPPTRPARDQRDARAARAALAGFAMAMTLSVWLRLRWTDGAWFSLDDFALLSERTAGDVGDLFRSHGGHWCTLPTLMYRLLWQLFGLRYLPYQVLAIALYVCVAGLVRAIMRRASIGPWPATAAASVVVFHGPNAENNFMTSAMCFGLVHLMLVDHDGPPDRRDWLGLGAGLAGLMCSGTSVTMTLVVGLAALLRRGWRIALLHTVPLGSAFLLWLATAAEVPASVDNAQSAGQVGRFVWVGLQEAFGRLGQLGPIGVMLGVLLVGGTVLLAAQEGSAFRRRAAASLSLSAGAVIFLAIVGVRRSGQAGILADVQNAGPEHARFYAYAVGVMVIPMLAVLADALFRRWRKLGIVALALFALAVPGYVRQFNSDARAFASGYTIDRRVVLATPRLPLAAQLPRPLRVGGFGFGGPTLGWLIDSLPSGAIPSPEPLTANDRATLTSRLAIRINPSGSGGPPCLPLLAPTRHVMQPGTSVMVRAGSAAIVYLPRGGGRSSPKTVRSGEAAVALAGPLPILITPRSGAVTPVACL